jgi:hypothetical protein
MRTGTGIEVKMLLKAYSETLLRQELWIGDCIKRDDGEGKGKVAFLRAMTDGQIV